MDIYNNKATLVLGNKSLTQGNTYMITQACNHHDFSVVLKCPNYTTLYYGTEVEFIDRIDKREGVFARVRCINTNITYDIDYTNIGDQTSCEEIKKKPNKAKVKEQIRKDLIKKIQEQRMIKLEAQINEDKKL